jgi:hypothetical protein
MGILSGLVKWKLVKKGVEMIKDKGSKQQGKPSKKVKY